MNQDNKNSMVLDLLLTLNTEKIKTAVTILETTPVFDNLDYIKAKEEWEQGAKSSIEFVNLATSLYVEFAKEMDIELEWSPVQ